ncbi:hypothetical protein DNTS_003666 [Danionella cerebrum]|uniref:CAP-Gly domain-containing protein n=1 Tax=Danionella cerebrum TaxID=2873325 RepID=A0A553MQT9_9TELE|nr:hypothetical protein DNTS_003666 [Danionella translucida]
MSEVNGNHMKTPQQEKRTKKKTCHDADSQVRKNVVICIKQKQSPGQSPVLCAFPLTARLVCLLLSPHMLLILGGEGEMTKEDVLRESSEEGCFLGQYTLNSVQAVIHQVAAVPMPSSCDFSFFDPNDPVCQEILLNPHTTVSELFAVLRQWVPQVQRNISVIGNEILRRGCGVNDRDGLTDMTLLHYCCKAGAPGIGDAACAAEFAHQLLSLGAEPSLRSRWTNMNALHYAAYFDVPPLIQVVVQASRLGEVDATCSDFDFGTALHIAASNLCTSAVRCLLELGANPAFRNEKGQCPADVVPDPLDMPLEIADAAVQAAELRTLLQEVLPMPNSPRPLLLPQPSAGLSDTARAQLSSMGLQLGDKVVIAAQKVGTLRFCGSTEFAGGLWAGVELSQPVGKNDGSVAGIQYFNCPEKHGKYRETWKPVKGIFAPLSKISKPQERRKPSSRQPLAPIPQPRRIDLARVKPTALATQTAKCRHMDFNSLLWQKHFMKRELFFFFLLSGCQIFSQTSTTPTSKTKTTSAHIYKQQIYTPSFPFMHCDPYFGIHGSVDCLSELSSWVNYPFTGIHRTLSTSSAFGTQRELNRKGQGSRNRSSNLRRRWSSANTGWSTSRAHASAGTVPSRSAGTTSSSGSDGTVKLHLGMQVLLISANEMTTIRYIGSADFAPGLWLGLELQSPRGKNDGSVGNRRYFRCRAGHGVLVRPSRVTYRGINGSKLVEESS